MGVPQGAVLSPLLRNIYTLHLLKPIRPVVFVAACANDISLYSSHSDSHTAVRKIEVTVTHLVNN